MRIGRFLNVTEINNIIIEYNQPALMLTRANQTISHNVATPISFDTEDYDHLSMWGIADPTNIHIPFDAIWTIQLFLKWAANGSGVRYVEFGGTHKPSRSNEIWANTSVTQEQAFASVLHIDSAAPFQIIVKQLSGAALVLEKVELLMIRHVKIAYPS